MPDLRRLRSDLRAFSTAIGLPLADWQAGALSLDRRTTVVVSARQVGKSRSLAVLALHRAFGKPDQRVLVVSAGEDAARRLLAEAAAIAVRSPLLASSVVDETAGLLTLSNGSEVRSVPASERSIRGWTVDLLLIDEAAQVDPDLLLGAAIPTTAARPDARIVLASSPGAAEGPFFTFAEQGDAGSEHVETFRWDRADATWINDAVVDSARAALAPAQFQREYEGEFADTGVDERVVAREWIAEAAKRTLAPSGTPVYAVDVARHGGDETVILSWRDGHVRVEWAARNLSTTTTTVAKIAQLNAADPGPFFVDAPGLGWSVIDPVRELGGIHVVEFQGSERATDPRRWLNRRSEAWWVTREEMRLGEIDLDPDDRVLAAQLGAQTYSLAANGSIQIGSKDKMRVSPDRADALTIAIWARAQQFRAEQIARLAKQQMWSKPGRERFPSEARLDSDLAVLSPDGQITERWAGGGDRRESIVPQDEVRASAGAQLPIDEWGR